MHGFKRLMTDSDIEEITNRLSRSFTENTNRQSDQSTKMPNNNDNLPRAVNYQLLKLYVDIIPNYEGNPHTLGIFIDNCENLISIFSDPHNPAINSFILRAIIGKLTGRALSLIGSRIELRAWDEIKTALTLSFGDQRNIDCLVQDLISLRPLKNESPYNFGMRCQDARSLIISKLNTLDITREEKIIRIQNYDDLALKTYIRSLPGQIQNNVRLRYPDSLEKAMSLVIEEENFLYSQNRSNALNSQSHFRPIQRIIPIKQNPKIQNFPQVHMPPRPIFQNNFPRPIFPNTQMPFRSSNNLPIQNSQMLWKPNNNFPVQKHSYFLQNANPNLRNPQQIPNQNQNRNSQSAIKKFVPEPMDTSSSNTRQQPRKTFTSTELYLQGIDENCENQDNAYENNFYENQYYNNSEYPEYYQEQEVNFNNEVDYSFPHNSADYALAGHSQDKYEEDPDTSNAAVSVNFLEERFTNNVT